jgi:drug/metabolite transporter (DMT)-like permease
VTGGQGASRAQATSSRQAQAASSRQALRGILLVLLAVACFATLDTTAKFLSTSVPLAMAMWFRFTFQAVSTTAVVLPLKGLAGLRTRHPRYQLLRGLLLVASSALAFMSLRFVGVAEFTAIISLVPLIITVVAARKLKEKVSWLRWTLVVGGFVGTLIVIQPDADDFNWHTLLPLAVVAVSVGFQLMTSHLARTEDPAVTHLYTGWIGSVAAALALPFVWVSIDSHTLWAAMCLVGVMGTVGHFMLILAYKHATPSVLTPYLYGQVVFAVLGGWLVFSQVPDRWSLLGIGLITACGALGTWLTVREQRNRSSDGDRVVPEPLEV